MFRGNLGATAPHCQASVAHNIDLSGFAALLDGTFRMMALAYPGDINTFLPFCAYQHAMADYLNTYLLSMQQWQNRAGQRTGFERDWSSPYTGQQYLVPKPIVDYVTGIGRTIAPTGHDVRVHLPPVAVPQVARIEANGVGVPVELAAGSFGPVTAETHNVYECYWSPLVTYQLIKRTIVANLGDDEALYGPWNPLPPGAFPNGAAATPNLLGYHLPEPLSDGGVAFLQSLSFGTAGGLRHSAECLARTTEFLRGESVSMSLISVPPAFNSQANCSLFLFRCGPARRKPAMQRLTDVTEDGGSWIASPFAADASAVNQANYFGYKRERTAAASGPCYVSAGGRLLAGWRASRNDNFNMAGAFAPTAGLVDRAWFREPMHRVPVSGGGSISILLWDFLLDQFRMNQDDDGKVEERM